MECNISSIDRAIRIAFGFIFIWAVLYIPMIPSLMWAGTIIGLGAIIFGLSGFCPIYSALNIKTHKPEVTN